MLDSPIFLQCVIGESFCDRGEEIVVVFRKVTIYGVTVRIVSKTVLVGWLREAGLMGSTTRDCEHQKQRCIELSLKGLLPVQVQVETGVPAEVVSRWLKKLNIQQNRRQFSQEEKQRCIELYLSGKSVMTVSKETDIPRSKVES